MTVLFGCIKLLNVSLFDKPMKPPVDDDLPKSGDPFELFWANVAKLTPDDANAGLVSFAFVFLARSAKLMPLELNIGAAIFCSAGSSVVSGVDVSDGVCGPGDSFAVIGVKVVEAGSVNENPVLGLLSPFVFPPKIFVTGVFVVLPVPNAAVPPKIGFESGISVEP